MTIEDRKLIDVYVKQIANGNELAFDNLYNMTKSRLISIAKHYQINDEDAEEIVNDVFDLLLKRSPFFNFYINCYKWLYQTTIKKAKNLNTKINHRENISKTIHFPTHVSVKESNILLKIEINKLPTYEMKKIVYYKYFCKLRICDIMKMFNMSRSSINRELQLARNILKEKL